MTRRQSQVGIVILNWKRPDTTRACLQSVARLDYAELRVVVVNNGVDVGLAQRFRSEFPSVTVLENGKNLGFAGGCNVGIRYLMQLGVDYVFLLNDDAEVAPDLFSMLVAEVERRTDVGIAGPQICYFDQPDIVWSAGGRIDERGHASHPGADQQREPCDVATRDMDYVTGCGMLIARSLIEAVGDLDERFFAYFEETELCARARRAGFRVVYVPHARMWHKIDMTDRTTSSLYLYLMARNRLLYLSCIGTSAATLGKVIAELLRTAASWALRPKHAAMRPYASALLRGVGDFLLGRFGPPPAYL